MAYVTLNAHLVGSTGKALALVLDKDKNKPNVRPLWLPHSKVEGPARNNLDVQACCINTANGNKHSVPVQVDVDSEFLAKIGVAA